MSGAGGQWTLIIPSHDLVVVRLGSDLLDSDDFRTGPRTASAPRGRLIMRQSNRSGVRRFSRWVGDDYFHGV